MKNAGILAFQGSVSLHASALQKCKAEVLEVRRIEDLDKISSLIIPGGESTTIGKLLVRFGMMERLRQLIQDGLPVYGTCAGMILLAKNIHQYPEQDKIGVLDIEVDRNAYGRQIESFETDLHIFGKEEKPFHSVFIRAPRIRSIGTGVEILAEFENEPVLVRQNNILAGNFHPEMTNDLRIHEYFLKMVKAV